MSYDNTSYKVTHFVFILFFHFRQVLDSTTTSSKSNRFPYGVKNSSAFQTYSTTSKHLLEKILRCCLFLSSSKIFNEILLTNHSSSTNPRFSLPACIVSVSRDRPFYSIVLPHFQVPPSGPP